MSEGPYRTPGDNGDTPPGMYRCGKCKAVMHPLNNSRRYGELIICMPCYQLLRPNGL